MRRLTFGLYLGANTVAAATDLRATLSDAVGEPIDFDPARTWPDRERDIHDGTAAIVWACGLLTADLQAGDRPDLEVVAAPVFPGREDPTYRSVVIARADAPVAGLDEGTEALTWAVNGTDSWSGYHALRALLIERGRDDRPFARIVETGGHDASIDALLAGTADVAAIDDTVWDARRATDPRLAALRVIDRTPAWPAPPFSLSRTLPAEVRAALTGALVGSAPTGLTGVVAASAADYAAMRAGAAASRRLGW
jgi:phosphonate transport system substrate-binding protein